MDETKEQLKQLIDFFTGPFQSSRLASSEEPSTGDLARNEPGSSPLSIRSALPISRQDINLIIKTLELCKKNFSHFTNAEKSYLLPLMTLCGHVLLTETHLIARSSLVTVSDILIYVLQFLLSELSAYSDDEANFNEFNAVYYRKLRDISNLSLDSEEYYRYLLKYRITKFLNFMLIGDNEKYSKPFFGDKELVIFCQMLCIKPLPDSLRCHSNSSSPINSEDVVSSKSFPPAPVLPATTPTSSVKRMRLSQVAASTLDRNSKEAFFDQLLTPFIASSNVCNQPTAGSAARYPPTVATQAFLPGVNIDLDDSPASSKSSASHATTTTGVSATAAVPASAVTTGSKSHSAQIKSYLISHNQMYFQYAGGANILLNIVNSYTLLRPYILHLCAIEEGVNLRFIKLDAANFDLICDRIASDIELVAAIFELNRLLEPLSCDRISKMVVTVQACLYACLTLILHVNSQAETSGNNQQEVSGGKHNAELERAICEIIGQSLALYSSLFDIFRQSNRVAGQICQNAHMFTAWLLFSGLQLILQANRQTANHTKQKGYAGLCNPLAKHALKLMASLLDDLHLEFGDQNTILDESDENSSLELNFLKKFSFTCPPSAKDISGGSPSLPLSPSASQTGISGGSSGGATLSSKATFKYNKFGHYSAWQRIEMIVSSQLNVIQLLFSYLSTGYRRACLLRSSSQATNEETASGEEAMSTSDCGYATFADKYFVQLMDTSGFATGKETDESLSALIESYQNEMGEELKQRSSSRQSDCRTLLERDADSHYELVIAILDHLNYYYICSKIDALQAFFKEMLTDAQLIVLAHIIQDLDVELDNLSFKLSPLLSKTFYKFSGSLTSLMHNLIAMQILTEEQQNSLLAYLGFKPSPESESFWQLYHGARSLAILAQVILLRQQKEKEDIKLDLNSITIQIWRGFINQLKASSLKFKGDLISFNDECPVYYEDLNVEHAQLMLFLFHNLKLLQRKHVFYLVGLALHEISVELNSSGNTTPRAISAAQILFIGRLLHLFEYMCKNLYDTPSYLFDQINHNLLNQTAAGQDKTDSTEELCKIEIEECLRTDRSFDSLRNILFFGDRRLELNYFNHIIANKDGSASPASVIASSTSSFATSLTASSTAAAASSGTAAPCQSAPSPVNTSLYLHEFLIHPRFYHLMDVTYLFHHRNGSSINFVPKLDGMACNFMLAGFPSLSYEQFYNSLLNLFQFLGHQYDVDIRSPAAESTISSQEPPVNAKPLRYPQLGPFGLCCLDYSFQTMWRLVNQLPPTLSSFSDIIEKVNSKNYEADGRLDAARVINMCIWIPRFENRAVYIWIRELLAKANSSSNNQQKLQSTESGDMTLKATAPNLEESIADLMTKFNSLQYNYRLFKTVIRTFFHFKVSNSKLSSLIGSQACDLPYSHPNVQFPKFFTLLAIDLYTERIMLLIKNEFAQGLGPSSKKAEKMSMSSSHHYAKGDTILTPANGKNLSPDSQELIYEKYLPQMIGLFNKLYGDINTLLIYDGSLAKKRTPSSDLKYHFYRSLVNICSTNCFDSSLSDISANIVDFLPHTILLKIDQWNRIYANVERSPAEAQAHDLISAGFPMEMPLVEVQSSLLDTVMQNLNSNGSAKLNTSTSSMTYVNHFSSFLGEKFSLADLPTVNSVETGFGNIAWIKLKQFWFKLFKFTENIYWTKNYFQHSDPFVVQLLSMQLNLVASSLTHNINEGSAGGNGVSSSNSYQILAKTFDLKGELNEVYCSALYPQFIRSSFFILTILKNGSFAQLSEEDQLKFQKVHQDCASEFFMFFSKILKKSSGKVAFEEFLCDTTPTTPTASNTPSSGTVVNSFSFLDLIEVASHPFSTSAYGINLLKLIKTLMSQADKYPDDISIIRLCSGLSSALAEHPSRVTFLFNWFHMILFHRRHEENSGAAQMSPQILDSIMATSSKADFSVSVSKSSIVFVDDSSNHEIYLLYKFVCYVIKDTSRFDEVVLASIAEALLPNARKLLTQSLFDSGNFLSFSGLFTCLVFLMSAAGNSDNFAQIFGKPSGHLKLIDEVVSWLALAKEYLSKKEVIRKIEKNVSYGRHQFILESCYQMLSYLSDIFNAFEYKFVHLKSRKNLSTDNEDDKSSSKLSLSLSSLGRVFIDDEFDFEDDHEMPGRYSDDDEYDEDDDEDLCDKLCTFTVTQKEFINQHWYHCHTCKMLDGVGVCNICAQVCHKGHDVTYSKHGSFFCDCGANEEGNCRALVKRPPNKNKAKAKKRTTGQSSQSKQPKSTSLYDKKKLMRISKYWYNSLYSQDFNQWKLSDNYKLSRSKFSNQLITESYERFGLKYEHFENFINLLMTYITPISDNVLTLVEYFVPTLEEFYYQHSELGYLSTIRKQFENLHGFGPFANGPSTPLSLEKCEQMLTPLKCSQDMIFENVQINTEQSQAVRNLTLITGAIVRRSSMLVLGASSSFNATSANVNPCLLLVAHDKNRVSVVQLNLLLSQVYSGTRRKLNPKKLAAITFPFTVMTMAHNPMNDELIAVCGLKDCHVLSLARSGSVTGHYSLFMTLDTNNYIIKALWLPNSQTELAIVTIDFIKVYDLSREDRDSPIYNFVIPSRKIRDMAFFSCEEGGILRRFALIFSSRGQIYAQELNADSMCVSASDSSFYLTTILNVDFPEAWSPSYQQTVVSFSIYYSHLLQMLFVSYLSGESFCAPFTLNNIYQQQIGNVTSLELVPRSPASARLAAAAENEVVRDPNAPQAVIPTYTEQPPLLHWTEVLTHPGMIFALTMNSSYPVCFMIKSGAVAIQEVKQKRKVIDFVTISCTSSAVRDGALLGSSPEKLTTMITLCEDGSLRFHKVCNEFTNYWLRPNFLSLEDPSLGAASKKLKGASSDGKAAVGLIEGSATFSRQPHFPVDYFEQCTYMNDIEFGGSDILEVYNTQQIKNRLNSANMYIACTKANGFTMTVTQTGNSTGLVMAGVRINLGVCDPARAPTGIEVFGRSKTVAINRHRWFDIPFSRSEIAQVAETKTFNIKFAPSGDANNVTIVDNIRVYGRQRDTLGLFVDDNDTQADSTAASIATSVQTATEDMVTEPYMRRSFGPRSGSVGGAKTPLQKLRLLLYSPTITDDDIILSATSTHQGIFVLNRLIANCLDVLESSFSFFKSLSEQHPTGTSTLLSASSSESSINSVMAMAARDLTHSADYQQKCDTALSIASKLLSISLSDRLDRSVCMLLAKLLPSRSAYDEHRDEVIYENSIENVKKLAFDDIIVFYYNLALFREMVAERPRNFVRFTNKYFVKNGSTDLAASSIQFSTYLSELFWRLYAQRPINELLAPVTKVSLYSNLESTVDSLVYLFYSSMLASLSTSSVTATTQAADGQLSETQLANIRKSGSLVVQLLCSFDPQISYSAKKALTRILIINTNRYSTEKSKPSKQSQPPPLSSKGPGIRERRHSARQPSKAAPPIPTEGGASGSNSTLRRQGAQRHRPRFGAGAPPAPGAVGQRREPFGAMMGGNSSNLANVVANAANADLLLLDPADRPDNVFERVSQSLLDGDFDAYRNLLLNVPMLGDDFDEDVYINDLLSLNIGAGGVPAPGQDEVDGDEDEEDEEDDDDDDELEDLEVNVQGNNPLSAPPPLFPMMDAFAPVEHEDVHADRLDEDGNEDDDEDDDDDDEEDEEEDYEAMDEAEDAMMELAIALSLQESGGQEEAGRAGGVGGGAGGHGEANGARAADAASGAYQALRYLRQLNRGLEDAEGGAAPRREMNTPPRRRHPAAAAPLPAVSEASPSNEQSTPPPLNASQANQQPQQQADYVMLHSESDDDDEELFDDELKIPDDTVESIEVCEEEDDDEELNSFDTSVSSVHSSVHSKSARSASKGNESTPKTPSRHASHLSDATEKAATLAAIAKSPACPRHRKRMRKMITSKFCLSLLQQMSASVDLIAKLDGVQAIPFLQVLIMLADFKYHEADHKEFGNVFSTLIQNLLTQMLSTNADKSLVLEIITEPSTSSSTLGSATKRKAAIQYKDRIERADENEVFLLLMRLFSVFLSRFKHYPTLYVPGLLNKDFNLNDHLAAQSGTTSTPTTPSIVPSGAPTSSSGSASKTVTFDEQSIRSSSSTSAAASKDKLNQASYSLLLTASQLVNTNGQLLNYCLSLLQNLLRHHWRPLNTTESEDSERNKAVVHGETIVYHSKKPIKIRPHLNFIPYDLKPFFMIVPQGIPSSIGASTSAQAEASAASSSDPCTTLNSVIFSNNVFDRFSELLTEMCLRLPYQLKKLISTWQQQQVAQQATLGVGEQPQTPKSGAVSVDFDSSWVEVLCEYMMLPSVTPYIRKQVRKLLAYLCGSKERYRQIRDYYAIKTNLRAVRRIIVKHFFDASSSVYALKLEDLDLTEDDLEDEEQLDELIDVIITNTFLNNDDQASQAMSGDQHRLLNLPYANLISLVDYLKACLEISNSRVVNWQRLCRRELRILPFLFRISLLFGEGVSSIILQLISLALFTENKVPGGQDAMAATHFILNDTKSDATPKSPSTAEQNMSALCRYVFAVLDRNLLGQFIRYFLLESNSTQHRWAAHSLLYHFYLALQSRQQEQLLALFWKLWPSLACYGKRASQFVDLLGYFTLTTNRGTSSSASGSSSADPTSPRFVEIERHYAESAIGLLKYQNQVLCKHPNANIYNSLQSLLEFNGFYLETEPCLVCNNPEVNFVPVKLSSIKLDSRFTTNTHIVKMIGSHTISKISLKISEHKKSKMVKTLSIFYNNRWVQSVVELKNKSTTWHKAKRVTLSPNQTEVKIEFALPIVACNLMIEYTNFYDHAHSSTETLQCPRCSSIVPANPGVCTNCGENVFQCHKCRAINYDEKDPYLCNSCGFCKYAKFDYVLTARYTATAVETIENEEDRAKAVTTINTLLDKADRLYKQILAIRPSLEQLLLYSQDYNNTVYCLSGDGTDHTPAAAGAPGSAATSAATAASSGIPTVAGAGAASSAFYVNRYIQQLASRYCNDCRLHFEELSKIVQKVLYTRKELVDYDNRQNGNRNNYDDLKRMIQERRQATKMLSVSNTSLSSSSSCTLIDSASKLKFPRLGEDGSGSSKKRLSPEIEMITFENFKSGRCFGCSSATIEHCITLLKALAYTPRYKTILSSSSLFRELIDYNLRLGTGTFRSEIRSLLCLLTRDNSDATEEFNNLLLEKIKVAFQSHYMTSFDFGSIRHEMALLAASFESEDSCWEQRLKCVMKLFLLSLQNKSPAVLEAITLPCLRILYGLIIKPVKTSGDKSIEEQASVLAAQPVIPIGKTTTPISFDSLMANVTVDLSQWLSGDPKASFGVWQTRNAKLSSSSEMETDSARSSLFEEGLQRKYFAKWLYLYQTGRLANIKSETYAVRIASSNWIQEVLFNPTSKALRVACRQLLMALFERLTNQQRVLIDLLTSFLDDLCQVGGETGLEFYDLYRSIIFSEYSPAAKAAANGNLSKNRHWRYYLALSGLLQHLGQLISAEIARLKQLEEATLSSDFSQGFALRQLVELLQIFMCDDRIRRAHKSSMVGFVLDGYLSLRMLIVQRTKMIDDTQTALLELLELLTTGTKAETINFMKVCIESVKKCSIQDQRTPVFIFERLCSIIYPEEKDADEFFISLEKDPQQEDFLQGRMLGNPYSSKDAGMGPLMRDIKNKICQECELVSLLEDDSGLELLVNNKIISLDLPVKEVYKKIVCAEHQAAANNASTASAASAASGVSTSSWSSIATSHLNLQADIALIDTLASGILGSNALNAAAVAASGGHGHHHVGARGGPNVGPTMKIIYRIRGLMGDATEEFIESFNSKESVVEDDEKRFELANIMAEQAGLPVMLERLQAIDEINNRSRQLSFVLLKLFGFCVRVVANRRALISPDLNAIGSMLSLAGLYLRSQQNDLLTTPSAPGEPSYFEQLLSLMETLLAEASRENAETFDVFNQQTCGTPEDITMLLNAVTSFDSTIYSATVTSITSRILRIITFLALGNNEKLATLLSFFKPYFDFDAYDRKCLYLDNPEHRFELLVSLLSGIENNKNGARLKDLLIEEGFVPCTIEYMVRNAPPMKNFLLINSEEWKDFTSRPALKYVLRMLTGLSHGHENTQLLITRDAIPIIHGLEQVLTDSHMATLAENLMDAIKENPSVEAKIQEVRLRTREEKKRIAMAVREKQLGELGMKANDKGQVMADSQLLKQMEEQLGEEKGLVCSICREGYQFQPQKVLAIYTFTKRCNVDENEDRKPRKTVGYTTVTHFNIIHVECHMSAVRHARTRDEWQSAALHNANTRCNGLLPLWGPQVYESLFAHALARHNSYLQDAVGQRDFAGSNSFFGTVHDLKLLLLRFATESTFSEETGGGGAQSNLYLTPYLGHIALYVMNTTKTAERERVNIETTFLQQPVDKWIESAFAADSVYFWSTLTLLLQSKAFWSTNRLYVLRRLILCEHLRHLPAESRNSASLAEISTTGDVSYASIKPALMFFALINLFYTVMFKNVEITDADTDWATSLATYIRHNDQTMLESADKMLDTYENDILLSTSFTEFVDAADLMRGADGISDPEAFLKDALKLPE